MAKRFNYTGTCIPAKHFMADTGNKLKAIMQLIDEGEYFSINRPRQYGKSTTMNLLELELEKQDYLPILISFEGIGDAVFENEEAFCEIFIELCADILKYSNKKLADFLSEKNRGITKLKYVSEVITDFVITSGKKVVLMIDEVDKSSNNQLFVSFLAMLRDKYLLRNRGKGATFHSIILAGVHDVKTLKLKLRPNDEKKYNSPWNIAIDLTVDLAFSAGEIESMLRQYVEERGVTMDIPEIARHLHYFTSGYPFLVSKLCYIIDTSIMEESDTAWTADYVDRAVDKILREQNTNFESLIKNLENNRELYKLVETILLEDVDVEYSEDSRLIKMGVTYGIFKDDGKTVIHNRIYKERIYNYMSLNLKIDSLLKRKIGNYSKGSLFIKEDNCLDFEKILLRFQLFMKEQFSKKDASFIESNWRLIFIAFLKPIINGHGFDFKEVQISEEKRLDVAVTYYNRRYICELKIWGGPKKHEAGLLQLSDYLERQLAAKGYLVIFDFRKQMDYKSEWVSLQGKQVFCVWV